MTTPSAAPAMAAPKPDRTPSTSGVRPPSLNQLAARININNATPGSALSGGAPTAAAASIRPRLAASVLRTGSTTSLSTSASTTDSMAVNAPSTRSASPDASPTTPPQTVTPSLPDNAGEPLTTERLEKLNQETVNADKIGTERQIKGYKNIPSLDVITQRLAMARSLSVDGSSKPPNATMIEDPKTPGIQVKAPEHPLQYSWTIFHDTKSKVPFTPSAAAVSESTSTPAVHPPESIDYEAGLTVIGEFDTVESFCRYFNWLKPPSKLERNSNYHLFKSGIKPMWEDEANANGGKWVLTMKNNPALLDRCWSWLAMALVGEELEEGDEICGAVVSLRAKVDRIQLWTRSKEDVEKLNSIGKKLVKLLDVSEADHIGLEFQFNTDDRPVANKFLSIQAIPTTGYRSNFGASSNAHSPNQPHSASHRSPVGERPPPQGGPGPPGAGAFGSFGIGIGGSGRGNWNRG